MESLARRKNCSADLSPAWRYNMSSGYSLDSWRRSVESLRCSRNSSAGLEVHRQLQKVFREFDGLVVN